MGIRNLLDKIRGKEDIPTLLKKGKITYDEALDKTIEYIFAYDALCFWDHTIAEYISVRKHNEHAKSAIADIEDFLAGKCDNMSTEEQNVCFDFFRMVKDDEYKMIVHFLRQRNAAFIELTGNVWGECIRQIREITGKELDIEDYIKRCVTSEMKTYIKEHRKIISVTPDFDYPDEFMFKAYIAYIYRYMSSLSDGTEYQNEQGLIIDKNGKLMEPDVFENYIVVDFKGLI